MANLFDDIAEEKLLNLHTAFIAKIISMENESTCTIQPLDKIKAYGKTAKSQAVISKVPILNHVRHYTLVKQKLTILFTHGSGTINPEEHPMPDNEGHLRVEPLRAGDIVLCVCAERDIASSIEGMSVVPPVGHHQQKDAVVVGLIGGW